MKKIAVINDLSGFGKCSLSAAMPIISAHGIQCCPLPTGIYSNQTDFESFKCVDMTPYLRGFIDEWRKLGASFDGILTGFIPNAEQGKIILDFIDEFKTDKTLLAVDPVMGDGGRLYSGYGKKSVEAVKRIAERAELITPNVTELAALCGCDISKSYSLSEIENMARSLGNKYVIVTGIENEKNELINAVLDCEGLKTVTSKKADGSFSGTGDIFASFVVSECLNGEEIVNAVSRAACFIEKAAGITEVDGKSEYYPDGIDFERLIGFV